MNIPVWNDIKDILIKNLEYQNVNNKSENRGKDGKLKTRDPCGLVTYIYKHVCNRQLYEFLNEEIKRIENTHYEDYERNTEYYKLHNEIMIRIYSESYDTNKIDVFGETFINVNNKYYYNVNNREKYTYEMIEKYWTVNILPRIMNKFKIEGLRVLLELYNIIPYYDDVAPYSSDTKVYSLFKPFEVPKKEPVLNDCNNLLKLFVEHMNNLFVDADEAELFKQVIAYKVQKPDATLPLMLILYGSNGIGKNVLLDTIRRMFGDYGTEIEMKKTTSNFNEYITNSLFGVFEEISDYNKENRDSERLKKMITCDDCRVNEKYIQERKCKNRMLYVGMTNNCYPLYISLKERRFMILPCKAHTSFEDMSNICITRDKLGGDFLGVLWNYFLNIEVTKNLFNYNVNNKSTQLCKLECLNKAESEIFKNPEFYTGITHSRCDDIFFNKIKHWKGIVKEYCDELLISEFVERRCAYNEKVNIANIPDYCLKRDKHMFVLKTSAIEQFSDYFIYNINEYTKKHNKIYKYIKLCEEEKQNRKHIKKQQEKERIKKEQQETELKKQQEKDRIKKEQQETELKKQQEKEQAALLEINEIVKSTNVGDVVKLDFRMLCGNGKSFVDKVDVFNKLISLNPNVELKGRKTKEQIFKK
jgi:hypothetical protein